MTISRRGKSFCYDFQYRQQRYRGSFGPVSYKTAEAQERKLKVSIAEGLYVRKAMEIPTFEDFSEEFMSWYKPRHRPESTACYGYIVKQLVRAFGHLTLDAMTTHCIERYMRDMCGKPRAPATVNLHLEVIHHILRTALRWKLILEHPAPSIERIPADEPETRILTSAEEVVLLAACHSPIKPLVIFGLYTGLRKGELETLTWEDIDWQIPAVIVRSKRAKSRRRREVPLCHTALNVLRGLPRTDGRVFGYRNIGNSFRYVTARAGLFGITPHVLRHTFATRCLEGGVNIRTVQRWLGHASVKQTERYTHPTSVYERQAIFVLDD